MTVFLRLHPSRPLSLSPSPSRFPFRSFFLLPFYPTRFVSLGMQCLFIGLDIVLDEGNLIQNIIVDAASVEDAALSLLALHGVVLQSGHGSRWECYMEYKIIIQAEDVLSGSKRHIFIRACG